MSAFNDIKILKMAAANSNNIDFSTWWYKNDLTHVFIFQEKTFEWIKKELGFVDL